LVVNDGVCGLLHRLPGYTMSSSATQREEPDLDKGNLPIADFIMDWIGSNGVAERFRSVPRGR
jgi:hypothetical protein